MSSARPESRTSAHAAFMSACVMLLIAALAAIALGATYGYAARHNPVPYANAFLYVLFALALGYTSFLAVRASTLRIAALAATVAIIAALSGMYAAWVSWLYQHGLRTVDGAAIILPVDVIATIRALAWRGVWRIGDFIPPAAMMYVIWSAEAVLVAGLAGRLAHRRAQQPFCEACRSWTKPVYDSVNLARPVDLEALRQRVEAGEIHMLASLPPADGSAFITVGLRQCRSCGKIGFLSIDNIRVTSDVNGRTVMSTTPLVEHLCLNGTAFQKAMELAPGAPVIPSTPPVEEHSGVTRW